MKKLIIVAIAFLAIFACFHSSSAKTFYRTYEVAEIQSEGIVLSDFEGGRFLVEKNPKGLKVGDSVRYDSVRNVLKKNPWQPATVSRISDSTITMQFKNGDTVDLALQGKYRGKFKKGEQIFYKASSKQIKKSNLQQLDDE